MKNGKHYVYIGPGDGKGLRHTVTSVGAEVTTWSDLTPHGSDGVAGYAWQGEVADFKEQFRPAKQK